MPMKYQKKSEFGFTLIEVIIVVAIIGAIAAIGAPSFNDWRQNANLNSDMRRLYGFFQKARMEAVKRNDTCAIVLDRNTYRSTVGAEQIDFGTYSNGVVMTAPAVVSNFSYNSRGLISTGTTITLKRLDQEFDLGGYEHDLVISDRGRMRIQ